MGNTDTYPVILNNGRESHLVDRSIPGSMRGVTKEGTPEADVKSFKDQVDALAKENDSKLDHDL